MAVRPSIQSDRQPNATEPQSGHFGAGAGRNPRELRAGLPATGGTRAGMAVLPVW